jgi:hypothetical protein
MITVRRILLGILILGGPSWTTAEAGHGVFALGLNIGVPGPGYYYRPYYYGYPYPVYAPYPVYSPVVVQPAPVVQPVPVPTPSYSVPVPEPAPAPSPISTTSVPPLTPVAQTPALTVSRSADINRHLQQLGSADERVREDSAIQLGRLHAVQAVDPLAATLAGDRSPVVREAAARSLGLLGSAQALPALQRAAQVDSDRDVRRSAQFAVEVIQSRN